MKLNELGLTNEVLDDIDYDNLPEEKSSEGFIPTLQPGVYVFELPTNLAECWEVVGRQGKKRVQAVLHGENSLTVHLKDNSTQAFSAWINNHAYPRGSKEGPLASDLQYLIRAFDPTLQPKTNPDFVEALNKQAGKKFKATVVWKAYCNPARAAYFFNEETGKAEESAEKGCGANYYQNVIPRDEQGNYDERFQCTECNAVVRSFPSLRNFQPVE